MKKLIILLLSAMLLTASGMATPAGEISLVSREDGSGTRGAFVELLGVEVKGDDGSKKDMTSKEAIIANKTDVVLLNISTDQAAIGYVSMGSLNAGVKALNIDGAEASVENVKNGSYPISRPFMIAFKGELSPVAQDFVNYILSKEGQEVVADSYIAVDDAAAEYVGERPEGKVTVAGSSSVTPVMEKLREAYLLVNPQAAIEIQMSDSTAGMNAAIEGTADIGMASRALKDSESELLIALPIALDGIAVIVHPQNPLTDIRKETVRMIYTGEIVDWSDIK